MTEIRHPLVDRYRKEWEMKNKPFPLVVHRSAYDDHTVSWEVCYHETPNCYAPIAEFTTFAEAIEWANTQAHTSPCAADQAKQRREIVLQPIGYQDIDRWQQLETDLVEIKHTLHQIVNVKGD